MFEPLKQAVAALGQKTPVAAALSSSEWEGVPLQLRQTAQFSSKIESARFLQGLQDRMMARIRMQDQAARDGKTQMVSRDTFINDMRKIALEEGLQPADEKKRGGLQDPTSIKRLGLIFDMQEGMAKGFARWKSDQNEGALLLYPAQELVRKEKRKVPREWLVRWQGAGGRLYGGRMIALKNDPIWVAISRFETPWPPFDYSSGMGLEDVDRAEAIRLGVIEPEETVPPADVPFTEKLEASTQGLSPEIQAKLEQDFGDQVEISDGVARWVKKTTEALTPEASDTSSGGGLDVVMGAVAEFIAGSAKRVVIPAGMEAETLAAGIRKLVSDSITVRVDGKAIVLERA